MRRVWPLNLWRTVSLHSVVHLRVKSLSKASWTNWAFLLWSIARLWSENTFLKVENEFLHIAVEAPNVRPSLKTVSTLGIAIRCVWYFERMYCAVQSTPIGSDCFCELKNCLATLNSVSMTSTHDRSIMCFTALMSRNAMLSGFSAESAPASCDLRSLNLWSISPRVNLQCCSTVSGTHFWCHHLSVLQFPQRHTRPFDYLPCVSVWTMRVAMHWQLWKSPTLY